MKQQNTTAKKFFFNLKNIFKLKFPGASAINFIAPTVSYIQPLPP